MSRLLRGVWVAVVLCVVFSCWQTYAQSTQSGVVMEYREELSQRPLQGVEILVSNANSSVSNKKGKFLLEFRTHVAGQRVEVRSITKRDYEVFNTDALEQWNINPNEPFVIKMVKSELFKRIKDEYSRVSSLSYKNQYDSEVARYKRERDEHRITEEAYQREIVRLSNEYDRQLSNMDNYIDRFARIDLSAISAQEREIIELVKEGRIDEAIKYYDDLNLVEQYEQTLASLAELKEAESKIQRSITMHEEASENLYQSLNNQINLLMMSGGEANIAKVNEIYKTLLSIDTTNIKLHIRYIGFCLEQTRYEEALACAEHLLTIVQTTEHKVIAYSALGDIYASLMRYDEALKAFSKAVDILSIICDLEVDVEVDVEVIPFDNVVRLSNMFNSYGLVYADISLMTRAIQMLEVAYQLRTYMVQISPEPKYYHALASTANSLANLYLRIYNVKQALRYCDEVVEIYETIVASDEKYSAELAKCYVNKSSIYYALGQYENAEPLFHKAIELYEKLVVHNPDRHKFDYAYALTDYGFMLTECGRYEEAYLYLMCASAVYDTQDALPKYMRMQRALMNMGICVMFSHSGEYSKIEGYCKQAFDDIAPDFEEIVEVKSMMDIYIRLFDVLVNIGLIDKAEEFGENLTEAYQLLYSDYSDIIGIPYYKFLLQMGLFNLNYKDDLAIAKSYFTQAKTLAQQFKINHPTYYYIYSEIAIEALVYICKCEGQFDEAMALMREYPDLAPVFKLNDPAYTDEDILLMYGNWSSIERMWNEVMRVDSIQLQTNAVNIYAY